jgi:hypothetical protein
MLSTFNASRIHPHGRNVAMLDDSALADIKSLIADAAEIVLLVGLRLVKL